MLHQTVTLIFVLFCYSIGDAYLINEIRSVSKDAPSLKNTEIFKSIFFRSEIYEKPLLLTGKSTYAQFTSETMQQRHLKKRTKRGIIFLDEEFDVPAKPGVKHGWSGNESQPDDEIFESMEKNMVDGSGDKEDLQIFEPTISELPNSTYQVSTTLMTSKENTRATTLQPSVDVEGSGDDLITFPTSQPEITFQFSNFSVPLLCLNMTCSSEDLIIHSDEFIPEGSNATLLCASKNHTEASMLYWYRYNGTMYTLQTYHNEEQLHLQLPNAKIDNSGKYVCFNWIKEDICCHKEFYITIYEIPPYKYHLLTIGIVAAMCLTTCILLAANRTKVMKKYTKQFITEQRKEKPLLI